MPATEALIAQVKRFLDRHDLSPEQLGETVFSDTKFCQRLFDHPHTISEIERADMLEWMGREDDRLMEARAQSPSPPARSRNKTKTGARDGTFGEFDYDRRIEIYKVLVDSAERGIDRRHALNRFYFSVVVAIFVSISFVVQSPNPDIPSQVIISGALLIAFLNSVLWLSMIFAARRLNATKYDVINELETHFEYAPFTREWQIHVAKRRNFPQFTLIEIMLPAALSVICFALFVFFASGILVL